MPHARSTQWFIHGQDIIPAEGGKLPAMRFMAEANGWTPDELMAFGDSENDNEMLRYAEVLGVAMGNALEETKAASLTMSRMTATTRAWPMRWHISR